MATEQRPFTIKAGLWDGHGDIPDGYSDGYYYVRGRLGLNVVHEWKGPFDTLETAQPYAVAMIEEWGFNFAKKFRSGLWRVEIGKRSWQTVPHRWYLYPEDSTDAATYREGLRAGTGKTVKTYVKPASVSYEDNTYHGYFPEDYAPDFFPAPPSSVTMAGLGSGVWAEVFSSPGVILNPPELFVPGSVFPTQTETYGPMSGFEYAIMRYGKVPETIQEGPGGNNGTSFLNCASPSAVIAVASDNSVMPPGIVLVGAEVQFKQVDRHTRNVWFHHLPSFELQASQDFPPFFQEYSDTWQYGQAPAGYTSETTPGLINSGPVQYAVSHGAETGVVVTGSRLVSTDNYDVINLPEYILPGYSHLAFDNQIGPVPSTDQTGTNVWGIVDNLFRRIVLTYSTRLVYEKSATGERIYSEFVDNVFRICNSVCCPFPYTFLEKASITYPDLSPYETPAGFNHILHVGEIPTIGNDGIYSSNADMYIFYGIDQTSPGVYWYTASALPGTDDVDITLDGSYNAVEIAWNGAVSNEWERTISLPSDIRALRAFVTQTSDRPSEPGFCCKTFSSGEGVLKFAGIQPFPAGGVVAIVWNKGDENGVNYPNGATYLNWPECFAYWNTDPAQAGPQGQPPIYGQECMAALILPFDYTVRDIRHSYHGAGDNSLGYPDVRGPFNACGVSVDGYTFGQSYQGIASGTVALWIKGPGTAKGKAVAIDTSEPTSFTLDDGTTAYYNMGIEEGPAIPGYGIFGYGQLPLATSSGLTYIAPLYVPGPALFFINADGGFMTKTNLSTSGLRLAPDPLPLPLPVVSYPDNPSIGTVTPNPLSEDARTYNIFRKPPAVLRVYN